MVRPFFRCMVSASAQTAASNNNMMAVTRTEAIVAVGRLTETVTKVTTRVPPGWRALYFVLLCLSTSLWGQNPQVLSPLPVSQRTGTSTPATALYQQLGNLGDRKSTRL